jgi:two-component system, OmpR family, sensor kinase
MNPLKFFNTNSSSIFTYISTIFFITLITLFGAFYYFVKIDKERYFESLYKRYHVITKATIWQLQFQPSTDNLHRFAKQFDIEWVHKKEDIERLLRSATLIGNYKLPLGQLQLLKRRGHHYLKIGTFGREILFKDSSFQPYRYEFAWVLFGVIIGILTSFYFATIRKLRPLRKIKEQMKKFGGGDLDIACNIKGNDEIASLANAFDSSTSKLNQLNRSRTLFLRNVMHELKTPITKGRITAQMIDNPKYQNRLSAVFERLGDILDEFATIEKLTSGLEQKPTQEFRLVDLIDEALDRSMIESTQICLEIDDRKLKVDFSLFSIALKNLIDNALKYGKEKHVTIRTTKESIEIINRGKMLIEPLEFYIEPFIKGTSQEQKDSLGLGLYIVNEVLDFHDFKLHYTHRNLENVFIIDINTQK